MAKSKVKKGSLRVDVPIPLRDKYTAVADDRGEHYTDFVEQSIRMRLAAIDLERDNKMIPKALARFLNTQDEEY